MVKYSPAALNRTFAALADPTRRRILAQLAQGDRCVTHLARPHAMSLPAVSKHLRVLEKAGLLRRRRYGRVHEMQLEAKPLKQAAQWVEEYRKFWEGSLDRLADYLEKTNKAADKERKGLTHVPAVHSECSLLAAGATSSGGVTAFAMNKILQKQKTNQDRGTTK